MPETIEHPAQSAAIAVNSLMKEYTEKLLKMRERAYALESETIAGTAKQSEVSSWHNEEKTMNGLVLDLSRQASQLIEFGAVDENTRIELKIRLTKLEAGIDALRFNRF